MSDSTRKYSHNQIKELLDAYMEPCLVIRNRRDFGKIIQLMEGETIIGRETEGVLDIGESKDGISRRHARFIVNGTQVFIEDLDSNNGVFVGNKKITKHELKDGETLLLGMVILQFQYLDPSEMEAYKSFAIDPLTGAFNKKYYLSHINSIIKKLLSAPVGFIMIDIDNLKKVNDNFGHTAGDYVLATFGAIVRKFLHKKFKDSSLFRFGGDEFIVILKDTDSQKALRVGSEIIMHIEQHNFTREGIELTVSVSVGTSSTSEFPKLSQVSTILPLLLEKADSKLYESKNKK